MRNGVKTFVYGVLLMSYFISERFSKALIFTGIFLLLVFLILFCYKAIIFNPNLPIKTDVFGQFGDIVGGIVGSLWALAGVILFYAGLTEQRKDIKTNQAALRKQIIALEKQGEEIELQRQEYEMARKIFEEQRDVLKEQSKTSKIQQFESNFYSLVNIYVRIRNEILSSSVDSMIDINKKINSVDLTNVDIRDKMKVISENYQGVYYTNKDRISHYLKTIYRLYKVIDDQDNLSEKDKYFYAKIVRSQFTEEELYLIYYNAHSNYGKNFRQLILKYNILKHFVLTSKTEFKCFNNEQISICDSRIYFINWLDDFITANHKNMNDIGIDEPSYSAYYNQNGIDKLLIELALTEEDDFAFSITVYDNEFLNSIGLDKGFQDFIQHYIYDRIILNNLERISGSDVLHFKESDERTYSFVLETDKSFRINSDTY